MKVLLVKLSALGDVVQALPVAMAIHRQMPRARVDWLVEEPSAGLLLDHPALDRVLVSPRHALREKKDKALPETGRFAGQLRSREYDYVVDLQGLMKSAIFITLARGRKKLGFSGGKEPLASWALNKRLPPYDPDRHALERYLDILEPMGLLRPAQPEFGLTPPPEAVERAALMVGELATRGPLVLLHPVAKWESKLWPLDHWVDLARRLAAEGAVMAISGSGADREWGAEIVRRAGLGPALADLTGSMSLQDLMAVIGRARGMVSTDTGVMHLAAALGLKVTALFGPTAPWRTGPYGPGHRVARLDLECSPCFKRRCPDPRCLTGLSPAYVTGLVLSQLAMVKSLPPAGEAGVDAAPPETKDPAE